MPRARSVFLLCVLPLLAALALLLGWLKTLYYYTAFGVDLGLLDLGAALVTAEAVGAAEAALEITTEFAKGRIQFDEQIGKFQGVKHPSPTST